MITVPTPRLHAHRYADISPGWFIFAVLLGMLLVCATSRSAAED
ncbi:hypothetical protein [Bradyrhizobium canariense]|nr:hypothetical protein [Bradyrhizobium canariense]